MDPPRRRPAFLLMGTEWSVASGGVSSFNILLATLLAKKGARVLCAVPKASEQEIRHATENGVSLVFPRRLLTNIVESLSLQLDNIPADAEVRWIVGHAHITGQVALDQLLFFHEAKFIFFNHVIPEDVEPLKENKDSSEKLHTKQKELVELAQKASLIFSVGPLMYRHFVGLYHGIEGLAGRHFEFAPPMSPLFLSTAPPPPPPSDAFPTVFCFGRSEGVHYVKGFDIAARAMGMVTENFYGAQLPLPRLVVYGAAQNSGGELRARLESEAKSPHIKIEVHPYGTPAEILATIRRSAVCLMPSRSEPFGLAGLEAIAAGVPVLVSDQSGLALLLERDCPAFYQQMVFSVSGSLATIEPDAAALAIKIVSIIRKPKEAFQLASTVLKLLRELDAGDKAVTDFERQCKGIQ